MKPSTKLGLRLFLLGSVFILTLLGSVVLMARLGWFHPPDTIEVYIGVYPPSSMAAVKDAQAVSLARLAQEIRKHPHATTFKIRRCEDWLPVDAPDWDATTYDREDHSLFDGNDYDAGETWDGVTDRAILNVAHTTGDLDDLTHYGCRNTTP